MKKEKVRILGLDPGSRITGFGIIETDGQHHTYIASGCIRLKSLEAHRNLHQIFQGLQEIIEKYQPHESAIEQIFMHQNPHSAIKLGQARGAAMVACANAALSVSEYTARQVKQAVVGYGAAKKTQVQQMVMTLLNLTGKLQADAGDALAVAICHGNSREGIKQYLAPYLKVKGLRRGRIR